MSRLCFVPVVSRSLVPVLLSLAFPPLPATFRAPPAVEREAEEDLGSKRIWPDRIGDGQAAGRVLCRTDIRTTVGQAYF
jgi:hypothetical protein